MPRTTIADVAQAAGVSVSTVSRALRGLDRVSPETRERIEQEAKRLHFSFRKARRPWRPAKPCESPCCCRTKSAAGSTPTPSKHLRGDIEGRIRHRSLHRVDAGRFGCVFQNLPGNRNVDAVIEASFDFDEAKKQVLGDLTIPVVGMNAPSTHGLDAGVAIDDEASMATIVRFLKSLGHKTLAYIEQPINTTPFVCSDRLRKKGFSEASQACGYADEDIIVMPSLSHIDARSEQDIYSGIVAQLLSAPKQPTAICVSVDAVAAPLLKELRRMGWRVPQDVSLVGFDDDDTATALDLTTMHQDPAEIGRIAARKTLALLNGETLDEPFTVMPTSLVLRGTTERVS